MFFREGERKRENRAEVTGIGRRCGCGGGNKQKEGRGCDKLCDENVTPTPAAVLDACDSLRKSYLRVSGVDVLSFRLGSESEKFHSIKSFALASRTCNRRARSYLYIFRILRNWRCRFSALQEAPGVPRCSPWIHSLFEIIRIPRDRYHGPRLYILNDTPNQRGHFFQLHHALDNRFYIDILLQAPTCWITFGYKGGSFYSVFPRVITGQ